MKYKKPEVGEFIIGKFFGPPIYMGKLSDDELLFLKEIATKSKDENISMQTKLAGNLEQQLQLVADGTEVDTFMSIITPHMQTYVYGIDEHRNRFFKSQTSNVFKFNIGAGPWINFQKPNEYNPVHTHNGTLSAIIYVDIPEELKQEQSQISNISNKHCPGKIDFIYGEEGNLSTTMHTYSPEAGDILFFPASLKHTVYPFKSNVERVSISFNVFDILVDDEENTVL
jgi:hypothetical protein